MDCIRVTGKLESGVKYDAIPEGEHEALETENERLEIENEQQADLIESLNYDLEQALKGE